jgi:hypothetical protein
MEDFVAESFVITTVKYGSTDLMGIELNKCFFEASVRGLDFLA